MCIPNSPEHVSEGPRKLPRTTRRESRMAISTYWRVDVCRHTSSDDKTAISLIGIRLSSEMIYRKLPSVESPNHVHIDNVEFGLNWGCVRICYESVHLHSVLVLNFYD